MHDNAQPFLALMLRLCAAGVLIQTLEVLRHRHELQDGHLFGREGDAVPPGIIRRCVGVLSGYPGVVWMLAARAVLAVSCLLLHYGSPAAFVLIGLLVLAQVYYHWRFVMLAGNCETMFLVCLVAAWAGSLPGADARLGQAALVFAALHVSLAYLAAGLHKLLSRVWREGLRLRQIAEHGSYRLPAFARRGLGGARAAVWTTRVVIALELSLGFTLLLPPPIAWSLLAAGLAFHTVIAVAMGLHGFWWAFAAAYPAVVYANGLLR